MTAFGIILILLAIGLIIGELHTGSGLLLICGMASLIIGVAILFTKGAVFNPINWWVVIPLIIVFTSLMIFSILRIIKTYHRQPAIGKEDMKGKTAVVREPLNPEGTILCQGELWNAVEFGEDQIRRGSHNRER